MAVCCTPRENELESQRGQLEELERDSDHLREQLRRKETEHQEALLQLRQHHTDGQRSYIHWTPEGYISDPFINIVNAVMINCV